MAQHFGVLVALLEDLNLTPSIHLVAHNSLYFIFTGIRHTCGAQVYMQTKDPYIKTLKES